MASESVNSLFHKLEVEAFRGGITPRSDQSRKWFREKVKELGKVNRHSLLKDPALTTKSRFGIGSMFMFFYDPKHRETLPYYDMFPLTIMVQKAPGGFYGLNLHYLAPVPRAKLMDALLDTVTNKNYDENTKMRINYDILNSARKFKAFQPCFKHYLTSHVDSKIVKVDAPEWEIALFLPTEQFAKKNKNYVWSQSRKSIV